MSTSLLGILNMSQRSLANNQAALNVVSNNISNMNNSNYTKQRVEFSALGSYNTYSWCSSQNLLIGSGAEVTGISRNREQWLDNYFREQNSSMGYYNQIGGMTNNIENMLGNELSQTGLQQKLNNFFKASQSLSDDPSNNAYRISFLESAKTIANNLNSMSTTLESQRNQAVGTFGDIDSFNSSQVKLNTDALNDKFSQLADLNGRIAQSSNGTSAANDLLDKRDQLLDEISTMVPITTTTNPNNTVNVMIGDQTIVKGGEQKLQIKAAPGVDDDNPVKIQLLDKDGNVKKDDISSSLTSGSIKGFLDIGSKDGLTYKSLQSEIDRVAEAFAKEMNRIQTQVDADGKTPMCIDANGKLVPSTVPLFVTSDGSANFTAGNIKLNDAVLKDPKLIATARVDITKPPAEWENAVGNSDNMKNFNNLKNLTIPSLSNSTPPGAGQTIENFLTGLVSDVGSKIQSINSSAKTQNDVLNQAASKRGAIIGVDLNEELTDMIKFQRAYEASSRIFNVANEMMQLITQLGK